jgi:hypothetical protein
MTSGEVLNGRNGQHEASACLHLPAGQSAQLSTRLGSAADWMPVAMPMMQAESLHRLKRLQSALTGVEKHLPGALSCFPQDVTFGG